MSAPNELRPDPRDGVFAGIPSPLRGALIALQTVILEGRYAQDPGRLLDEIALVLETRLDREDRGILLLALARATDPEYIAAFAEAARPRFYGPTGAPDWPDPTARRRPHPLNPEERQRAAAIPDFDLPEGEFLAIQCTSAAPLDDRKRAFVRIWESFPEAVRLEFMARVVPRGEFRRDAP